MPFRSHYIPPLGFFFSSLLFAKSNCEDTFILKFFFKTLCLEIVSFHSRRPLQRQPHEGGNAHKGGRGVRRVRPWGLAASQGAVPPAAFIAHPAVRSVPLGCVRRRSPWPATWPANTVCQGRGRPVPSWERAHGPRPGLENAESTAGFSPGPSQAAYCRLHFVALPEHLA